jgi:hypothetical protein
MGHEFRGGTFRLLSRASAGPARISAVERHGMLEVRVESELAGRRFVRWLWLRGDSPELRLRIVGSAARRLTVACRFPSTLSTRELVMDVPGGVVRRPAQKLHDPTFWAARSFVHLQDAGSGAGLAAVLGGPACCSLDGDGALQWVVLRNAPRELAWGFVPVLAHPASGADDAEHAFDGALWLTASGDYLDNRLPARARRVLREERLEPGAADYHRLAQQLVSVTREDVLVSAVKPASRGQGLILRLESHAPPGSLAQVTLRTPNGAPRSALLCDALERDRQQLTIVDGAVQVPLQGSLTSVRLIL